MMNISEFFPGDLKMSLVTGQSPENCLPRVIMSNHSPVWWLFDCRYMVSSMSDQTRDAIFQVSLSINSDIWSVLFKWGWEIPINIVRVRSPFSESYQSINLLIQSHWIDIFNQNIHKCYHSLNHQFNDFIF